MEDIRPFRKFSSIGPPNPYEFIAESSSVSEPDAHIVIKPETRATTTGRLTDINTVGRKPNEDAFHGAYRVIRESVRAVSRKDHALI
ncbi:hypothetical protein CWO89_29550 [Bradyrhizobium sp. Leo170]|nr:hypothetical protein CWO89_29550 [Bradyrhizobium sp. Leo170]